MRHRRYRPRTKEEQEREERRQAEQGYWMHAKALAAEVEATARHCESQEAFWLETGMTVQPMLSCDYWDGTVLSLRDVVHLEGVKHHVRR